MTKKRFEVWAIFPNGKEVKVETHTLKRNAQSVIDAMNAHNQHDLSVGYGFPYGVPTYEIKYPVQRMQARFITGYRLLVNEREVTYMLAIRNQHKERLEAFKRVDCDALDRLDAELKGFWNPLVKQLLSCEIDGFSYEKGNTYIFTRSIKEPGKIQKSCFWNHNGEMIPLSDVQLSGFCAAEFPHGVSVNVQERR